jgi:hypothetical protein
MVEEEGKLSNELVTIAFSYMQIPRAKILLSVPHP